MISNNAFCTASELGRNDDGNGNGDIEMNDHHTPTNHGNRYNDMNQYLNDGSGYNNAFDYNSNNTTSSHNAVGQSNHQLYNPYVQQQQQQQQYQQPNQNEDQSQQHNPHRPSLSAGLKRKFQTPKLGLGNTTSKGGSSTSNSNNNNNNSKGGWNQSINKSNNNQPSSSKGNKGNSNNNNNTSYKTSNNNNNKNNDDDDDLPEELKGLDKDLITKIENEIVDLGDPITFQDIAGLEDAKQTVLELVCWPMKRPDLFTGLRRGPNGLLLFGPPGTG